MNENGFPETQVELFPVEHSAGPATVGGVPEPLAGEAQSEQESLFDRADTESLKFQLESFDFIEADSSEEELELVPRWPAVVEAEPQLMQSIENIPDKMAFKIGEAADMVGVKQYVLRYWETEFEQLRPKKSKNGQRIYSRRDVEIALMIKKLLYSDRFSIEGARAALRGLKTQVKEVKEIKTLAHKHDAALDRLRALVEEISRIQKLFN